MRVLATFQRCLIDQFGAALAMLEQCVERCPPAAWEAPVGNYPFWHVAYHVLFYTDLYLSPNEESFEAPSFQRENYELFGGKPWPPYEAVVADIPFDKPVIRGYVEICRRKASQSIAAETPESLDGPPGFSWYHIPRAEFYLNNLRHLQHHTAQLSLALRKSEEIEITWQSCG